MASEVRIIRLDRSNWELLRDLRLRALQDSPDAFGASFEDKKAQAPEKWMASFDDHAWFVAWDEGTPVGLVAGQPPWDGTDGERDLTSMWVAPSHRGRGTGSLLLAAVIDWAREDGAPVLSAWVVEANQDVQAFYEAHGFAVAGNGAPLDRDPSQWAQKLSRPTSL